MIVPVNAPVVTADGKGATTDATGKFVSTTLIHAANWAAVRLVGQTTGQNAVWNLASDNGLPLDFANGALASMGLVLIAPGQRPTLTITGATANSAVLAQFVGVMSPSLDEVLPYYLPSPNPLGISISGVGTVTISGTPAVTISGTPTVSISGTVTFSNTQIAVLNVAGNLLNMQLPQTELGSATPAANVAGSIGNFNVPAGTHGIGVFIQNGGVGGWWSAVKVYGNSDGVGTVLLTNQTPRKLQYVFPIMSTEITTVACTFTRGGTVGNPKIALVAILDSQVVYQLASRGDDDLPASDARPQGASLFNIPSTAIAAAGTLAIEGGVAGYFQVIWVVQWEYSTAGTGITQLELSDGTILASTLQTASYPQVFRGGGIIYGAAGLGLQFRNTGAAAVTLNGYAEVGFSPLAGRAA